MATLGEGGLVQKSTLSEVWINFHIIMIQSGTV